MRQEQLETTENSVMNSASPCFAVRVNNLSFSPHRRGPILLHPLNFELEAGKILGVVGANGAGKSTLLRLLYRFHKPMTGEIYIGDENLWRMSPRQSALKIAAVLQEQPHNFAFTVREIVALGRTPHLRTDDYDEIIDNAIARLDLDKLRHRNFLTLSGGERQRVMIARALAQKPEILILDEPSNHLDIRQKLEIMKLVKELPQTIVISIHDLNTAIETCDEILLLEKGVMRGYGAPFDVLNEDAVAQAFDVRARRERLNLSQQDHLTFYLNNEK